MIKQYSFVFLDGVFKIDKSIMLSVVCKQCRSCSFILPNFNCKIFLKSINTKVDSLINSPYSFSQAVNFSLYCLTSIIFKMDNTSPKDKEIHRKNMVTQFLLQEPKYNIRPPSPAPHPLLVHTETNRDDIWGYRLLSSQMNAMAPLLVGCDLGLPVEELILFGEKYNLQEEDKLNQIDEILLRESIMKKQ